MQRYTVPYTDKLPPILRLSTTVLATAAKPLGITASVTTTVTPTGGPKVPNTTDWESGSYFRPREHPHHSSHGSRDYQSYRYHSSDSHRYWEEPRFRRRTRTPPLSQAYGRRDQDLYTGRNHRLDKHHRSCSKDRSQSQRSRDPDRHSHQRKSRSSHMGRKDSLLSSFSSYEEYLEYFSRSGASNQGPYQCSQDTLHRWGRSYKDAQSLPPIPRQHWDSPPPWTSPPSAALGAHPKGSSKCPDQIHSPQALPDKCSPSLPDSQVQAPEKEEEKEEEGSIEDNASITSRAPSRSEASDPEDSLDLHSDLSAATPAEDCPLASPHGKI